MYLQKACSECFKDYRQYRLETAGGFVKYSPPLAAGSDSCCEHCLHKVSPGSLEMAYWKLIDMCSWPEWIRWKSRFPSSGRVNGTSDAITLIKYCMDFVQVEELQEIAGEIRRGVTAWALGVLMQHEQMFLRLGFANLLGKATRMFVCINLDCASHPFKGGGPNWLKDSYIRKYGKRKLLVASFHLFPEFPQDMLDSEGELVARILKELQTHSLVNQGIFALRWGNESREVYESLSRAAMLQQLIKVVDSEPEARPELFGEMYALSEFAATKFPIKELVVPALLGMQGTSIITTDFHGLCTQFGTDARQNVCPPCGATKADVMDAGHLDFSIPESLEAMANRPACLKTPAIKLAKHIYYTYDVAHHVALTTGKVAVLGVELMVFSGMQEQVKAFKYAANELLGIVWKVSKAKKAPKPKPAKSCRKRARTDTSGMPNVDELMNCSWLNVTSDPNSSYSHWDLHSVGYSLNDEDLNDEATRNFVTDEDIIKEENIKDITQVMMKSVKELFRCEAKMDILKLPLSGDHKPLADWCRLLDELKVFWDLTAGHSATDLKASAKRIDGLWKGIECHLDLSDAQSHFTPAVHCGLCHLPQWMALGINLRNASTEGGEHLHQVIKTLLRVHCCTWGKQCPLQQVYKHICGHKEATYRLGPLMSPLQQHLRLSDEDISAELAELERLVEWYDRSENV
jgi:hypothetical protein